MHSLIHEQYVRAHAAERRAHGPRAPAPVAPPASPSPRRPGRPAGAAA